MIRKITAVIVFALLFPILSPAASTALSGAVMNPQGQPIPGALVLVRKHDNSPPPADPSGYQYRVTTDQNGLYMIQGIGSGDFDVTCEMQGYQTQTETVKIQSYLAAGAYCMLQPVNGQTAVNLGSDVFHVGPVDFEAAKVYVAFGTDSDSNPDLLQPNKDTAAGAFPTDSPYGSMNELGAIEYGGSPMKDNPLMQLMMHGGANDNSQLIPITHPNSIVMLDQKDNKSVAAIPTSARPYWLAFSPDGQRLWVVDDEHNLTMFSNRGDRLASVNLGDSLVSDLAVSPDGDRVYLAMRSWPDPEVMVADGVSNALVGSDSLPSAHGQPGGVAIAADGRTMVVSMGTPNSGWLEVLDAATGQVVREIQIGSQPTGVGITPDGSRAVVANYSDGTVDIVDLQSGSVVASIETGLEPSRIAMRSDGRVAFVTNSGDDSMSVIDVQQGVQLAKVPVGKNPMGVAVTLDGKIVYVANNDDGNVTVIDGMTLAVLGTTPQVPGEHPYGVAIRP